MASPISSTGLKIHKEAVGGLPDQPGVYLFKNAQGHVLYIGKAVSLRKRVSSYFRRNAPLGPRLLQLVQQVTQIEVRPSSSEAEALLLEVQLIKAHQPRYNVAFRDDKSYPMLKVTHEPFPRLIVTRRKQPDGAWYFGPYPNASLMHAAVQFMRRVFPLRTCSTFPKSPCLEYHLGQCLAPCAGYIDRSRYQRIVRDLLAFLRAERGELLRDLTRRMEQASRSRRFEEAARLRDQIQALSSVVVAKEKSLDAGPLEELKEALKLPRLPRRIEAFDVSNLFGTHAVGSMVVFIDGKPHKAHYRHFQIQTVSGIDDYQMMRELVRRRYSGSLLRSLPFPELILIDGGKGHLHAACEELSALSLTIPAIGLAKQLEQIFVPTSDDPIVLLPTSVVLHLLQHVRDEAHRFAITHHRRLRRHAIRASVLDAIAGIGPKRKAALLAEFGSISRLAQARPDELSQKIRISRQQAEAILTFLRSRNIQQSP